MYEMLTFVHQHTRIISVKNSRNSCSCSTFLYLFPYLTIAKYRHLYLKNHRKILPGVRQKLEFTEIAPFKMNKERGICIKWKHLSDRVVNYNLHRHS